MQRTAPAASADAVQVLREFRLVFNAVRQHFQQVERATGLGGSQAWALGLVGERPGIGSTVKAVNQLLAGVNLVTAAEGMAFGTALGADPRVLFEVIRGAAGGSWMFENRVPHMLDDDFAPKSAVDIWVKDLALVLDKADLSSRHHAQPECQAGDPLGRHRSARELPEDRGRGEQRGKPQDRGRRERAQVHEHAHADEEHRHQQRDQRLQALVKRGLAAPHVSLEVNLLQDQARGERADDRREADQRRDVGEADAGEERDGHLHPVSRVDAGEGGAHAGRKELSEQDRAAQEGERLRRDDRDLRGVQGTRRDDGAHDRQDEQAEHVIEADTPAPEVARHLQLDAQEPVLVLNRRTWSGGRVVSVAKLFHPARRYRLSGRFSFTQPHHG